EARETSEASEMRKGGLEPPRYCYRQPLKLVRLPIPPLPRAGDLAVGRPEGRPLQRRPLQRRPLRHYFLAGAGAALLVGTDGTPGATGAFVGGTVAGVDGCVSGVRPPSTEFGLRLPMMPSASAPTMNRIAAIVVARDSTVAPLRAPKADWL